MLIMFFQKWINKPHQNDANHFLILKHWWIIPIGKLRKSLTELQHQENFMAFWEVWWKKWIAMQIMLKHHLKPLWAMLKMHLTVHHHRFGSNNVTCKQVVWNLLILFRYEFYIDFYFSSNWFYVLFWLLKLNKSFFFSLGFSMTNERLYLHDCLYYFFAMLIKYFSDFLLDTRWASNISFFLSIEYLVSVDKMHEKIKCWL